MRALVEMVRESDSGPVSTSGWEVREYELLHKLSAANREIKWLKTALNDLRKKMMDIRHISQYVLDQTKGEET